MSEKKKRTCPKCGSSDPGVMIVAYSFRYGRWREIDERSCEPDTIGWNQTFHREVESDD